MRALSFGEILWDVYPDKKYIGGAPLNFAAHFARHGGEVRMLSSVGCDELGNEALDILKKWKVGTELVNRLPDSETGRCVVTLDTNGVPSYSLLENVAWDRIDCDNVEGELLYYGTLALRGSYNRQTLDRLLKRSAFSQIFCDVNIRRPFCSSEALVMAVEHATLLKISEEELPDVLELVGCKWDGGSILNACVEIEKHFLAPQVIIITRGADGAAAYERSTGKLYEVKAHPCTVVSTVGAGDSFSAAFLWKYVNGCELPECLEHASRIAAITVSHYDAVPKYSIDSI